jgi:hypothetical protein
MEKRGQFFDYDPLTGLEERYEETNDGKIHIHTYQDVGKIVDHTRALANSGMPDEAWKKQGVSVYAKVPLVVIGQMMKKGIKFFDPNHIGAVVREVNQNYPWLKTTDKNHEVRAS